MDRMGPKWTALAFAAGHVAMPANYPNAATPSEPRPPYPMPDGRSRHMAQWSIANWSTTSC